MKINQLLIFLILPINLMAQLSERFSDGNFTANPEWIGDTALFKVDSLFEIQSHGPATSAVLSLSTASTMAENSEWQFFVRMDFSPSTTNYAKFYLLSDQQDLKNNLNGYFVRIGGISGNMDAIELYRQEGSTTTKIIAGIPGNAGKNTNTLRIKVTRDLTGNWELFSDTLGTNNYVLEGRASDTTFHTSAYLGFVCYHTSTRNDKFFFDDILVDNAPLSVLNVYPLNDLQIDVAYSSPVDFLTANEPSNYFISKGIGFPSKASVDSLNNSIVHLTFSSALLSGNYTISVNRVKDLSGGEIKPNCLSDFIYRKPLLYGSVLINEGFADPTPVQQLPEAEYVELYNSTSDTINLKNFTFSDPSTEALLPSYPFAPYSYLILCSKTTESSFTPFGNVLSLTTWPSLNNSGDQLQLKGPEGRLIYSIHYSDTWYQDNAKKDGGWSLELIDPGNLCGEENNWLASEDPMGGTPGKVNSVKASKPDLSPPLLVKITIEDSLTIKLTFNEPLDTLHYKKEDFSINPVLEITEVKILNSDIRSIYLKTTKSFLRKVLYEVKITSISDCNGNSSMDIGESIALAEPSDSGDVIINEILFNPRPDGLDFVEIYNRSDKFIDLSGWEFANYSNSEISNKKKLSSESLILKPNEYLFFTADPAIIKSQYPNTNLNCAKQVEDLPSFNDDAGTVILLNNGIPVDRFDYNENFHFALIQDKEGVSLERISAQGITNSADNWHSAASTEGYATPGYKNSQAININLNEGFLIDPKVITPDDDGYKDFTTINYKFNTRGNMLNITIFDAAGREVKQLVKNQLAGKEGFFQWDGLNDSGEKVRMGHFILFIQVFNLEGMVKHYKESVVVGSKH